MRRDSFLTAGILVAGLLAAAWLALASYTFHSSDTPAGQLSDLASLWSRRPTEFVPAWPRDRLCSLLVDGADTLARDSTASCLRDVAARP
jgi:hypothetical protein